MDDYVYLTFSVAKNSVAVEVYRNWVANSYRLPSSVLARLTGAYSIQTRLYYETEKEVSLTKVLSATPADVASWRVPLLNICRYLRPPELWRFDEIAPVSSQLGLRNPTVQTIADGVLQFFWEDKTFLSIDFSLDAGKVVAVSRDVRIRISDRARQSPLRNEFPC